MTHIPHLDLATHASALSRAIADFRADTGDTSPTNAYRGSSAVKHFADQIFERYSYLGTRASKSASVQRFIAANPSKGDEDDICQIALFGQDGKAEFGGLMGAILNINPELDEPQIVEYLKLRTHSEAIDHIRAMIGRNATSAKMRIFSSTPFSFYEGRSGAEPDERVELSFKGQHFGVGDEHSFGVRDAGPLMKALATLPDEYRNFLEPILYEAVRDGDLRHLEKTIAEQATNGHKEQAGRAMLALKCSYLQLSDDELPDEVVFMKDRVKKCSDESDLGGATQAFRQLAMSFNIPLREMGYLAGVSESRISQIASGNQFPEEVIIALGMADRVSAGMVYAPEPGNEKRRAKYYERQLLRASEQNEREANFEVAPRAISTRWQPQDEAEFGQMLQDMDYLQSLGFRISYHQRERGLTNTDLVTRLNDIDPIISEVDLLDVHRWKNNEAVPDKTQMVLLVRVLVHENKNIASEDKPEAARRLYDALEYTQGMLAKQGEPEAGQEEAKQFSAVLLDLMRETKLDERELVAGINRKVRSNYPEYYYDELNEPLIDRVMAGKHIPSQGMMMALVRALDEADPEHPLSEREKDDLYKAHKELSDMKRGENTGGYVPWIVRDMRARLFSYFTDKSGNHVGITRITNAAGLGATLGKRLLHDDYNELGPLILSTLDRKLPALKGLLAELGKDEQTQQQFEQDYYALYRAVTEVRKQQGLPPGRMS